MSNEAELVQAAIAGDTDALVQLLEAHGPTVRARLAPTVGPSLQGTLELDDVMQVSYLEAFMRISRFNDRGEGAFLAWLQRVAQNNLSDALRELGRAKRLPPNRRITPTSSDESAAQLLDQIGWTSTTPSRDATSRELTQFLMEALDRLPPDYAQVLRRYDLEAREVEAIASELGRSIGAIYMLRSRALDRLREILADLGASRSETA